jgi:hypothetical protein
VSRIVCNSGPLIALGILVRRLQQEGYWIHGSIVEMALREVGEK